MCFNLYSGLLIEKVLAEIDMCLYSTIRATNRET